MFPATIETERLVLEQFSHENVDIDDLISRFGVEAPYVDDIFNQIPDDPLWTAKNAIDIIDQAQEAWEANESAMYAVVPNADEDGGGELAGYAHLWMKWDHRKAELGLLLDKPYWGREYATEVYLALTEVAFDIHGIDVVVLGHPVPNTNSQRSIEKFIDEANGQFDGVFPNNVQADDTIWDSRRYSVTKEDFGPANR